MGAEIAFEWQTMGEQNWQQYFAFPAIGLGVVGLDWESGNAWSVGCRVSLSEFQTLRWY